MTTKIRRSGIVVAFAAATQAGCIVGPPPLAADEPPAQPAPEPWPSSAPQARQAPFDAALASPPSAAGQPDGSGTDDAAVEDFIEPLANYGAWVDVAPYGRVWQPADDVAGEGFRPYASDGSWAVNDDGSWVFQSQYDREWGWATYHYGRWVDQDTYGWVWVPGTTWAPSWVEWRYGGGYVGWAAMGPPGVVVPENRWVFVEQRRFAEGGPMGVVASRLPPERVHLAFVTAAPVVEMRGAGHWTVGPSPALLRAAGVPVRAVHVAMPGRGYVRGQAAVSMRLATGTRSGMPPAVPTVRRSGHPESPAPVSPRPIAAPPVAARPEAPTVAAHPQVPALRAQAPRAAPPAPRNVAAKPHPVPPREAAPPPPPRRRRR